MQQIVAVTAELVVEGADDAGSTGPFQGRVIAIAVDDAQSGRPPSPDASWLLVADDDKPRPVWVPQTSVTAQRLGR